MSIASFQAGTITMGGTSTSESDTLSITVTQANSILIAMVRGGSSDPGDSGVRVVLSSDGTTVTATSGEFNFQTREIVYFVIESTAFTVQHFSNSPASTTENVTITSVDTDYSFIVCTGMQSGGSTRGNDDVAEIEITTATNAQIRMGATGGTVAFQVVEMSSSEIASVQFIAVNQTTATVNETISAVTIANTLLFGTCQYAAGGTFTNANIPTLELTSTTNLQSICNTADSNVNTGVYVVEFVNLTATHARTTAISGPNTTESVSAPTYGGAIINGMFGRYGAANDTDDDHKEVGWTADLSGTTWTFTRGASTVNAELSYSVFDWDDLFSGGAPVKPWYHYAQQ